MFIDIHVHTKVIPPCPRPGNIQAFATPEQLLAHYDKHDIERAVLLPIVSPECEIPQSNEEILEVCRQNDRFIPFCNIDPRAISNSADAPLGDILRYYKAQGCKGLGEVTANLPFTDPKVQNLFKHVEAVGFPLIFHIAAKIDNMYGLYDDPGLPQLEYSLQKFPKLKFFGHSQTFWAEMGELDTVGDRFGYPRYPIKAEGAVPKLMRKYGNLYGDLSAGSGCNALARDEAYAIKFLNEFQDRLMFGTDICVPNKPTPLVDFLLKLKHEQKISNKVFAKIAKENAIRILEL